MEHKHITRAVDIFNSIVSPSEVTILASTKQQRTLSQKIEDHQFSVLFEASTLAYKARLLSTSAPHASSWLLVTPATGLDLHLEPNELQTAVKWWFRGGYARETRALCAQIQHLIGLEIMLPLASVEVIWSLATIT